jgi:DNA polymerase-1
MSFLNTNCYLDEITDIEYMGEEETFDLTVEDDHSFIANDFVAHNTSMYRPNLQQLPQRGMPYLDKLRELYKAPDGYLLGERDMKQSEMRIIAWLSEEKQLLNAMYNGLDVHRLTASKLIGCMPEAVTKEQRQLAKGVNFGLIYGASAKTLQIYMKENYGISISYDKAVEYRNTFFNTYPAITRFHTKVKAYAHKNRYIRNFFGRIRHLPTINDPDWKISGRAERQAVNFVVQSFSSDYTLIGMYMFYKDIEQVNKFKYIYPLAFIHDAVFFTAREDIFDLAMKDLKHCMEVKAKYYIEKTLGKKIAYPIESDGKAGANWADLKDYED